MSARELTCCTISWVCRVRGGLRIPVLALAAGIVGGCSEPIALGGSSGFVGTGETTLRIEPARFAGGLRCSLDREGEWVSYRVALWDLGLDGESAADDGTEPTATTGLVPCRQAVIFAVSPRYFGARIDGVDAAGVVRWRTVCGLEGQPPTRAVSGSRVPLRGCLPLSAGFGDAGASPDAGSLLDAGQPEPSDAGAVDAGRTPLDAGLLNPPAPAQEPPKAKPNGDGADAGGSLLGLAGLDAGAGDLGPAQPDAGAD